MVSPTYIITDENEVKLLDAFKKVLAHGYGVISVRFHETRNFKTKVEIEYSMTQVSFIDKTLPELEKREIY